LGEEINEEIPSSSSIEGEESSGAAGRRTSYYVEENEKILNLLITNCEPILSEMVTLVNHFNSYNKIEKVVEKHGINIEDVSVQKDCLDRGAIANLNSQKLFNNN
jgi:hypothetical protein